MSTLFTSAPRTSGLTSTPRRGARASRHPTPPWNPPGTTRGQTIVRGEHGGGDASGHWRTGRGPTPGRSCACSRRPTIHSTTQRKGKHLVQARQLRAHILQQLRQLLVIRLVVVHIPKTTPSHLVKYVRVTELEGAPGRGGGRAGGSGRAELCFASRQWSGGRSHRDATRAHRFSAAKSSSSVPLGGRPCRGGQGRR